MTVDRHGKGFVINPSGTTFFDSFVPVDVNNVGQVLGILDDKAAVWTTSAGFQILDTGIFPVVSPVSINDNGQIVGNPPFVPEPLTSLMCVVAGAIMAVRYRYSRRI